MTAIDTETIIDADAPSSITAWPLRRLVTATLVVAVIAALLGALNLVGRLWSAEPVPVSHKLRFELVGDGFVQATGIWLRTGDTLEPAPGAEVTELTSKGLPIGLELDYPTAGAALLQVRAVQASGCRIVVDGAVVASELAGAGQLATCLWVEVR